MLQVYNLKDRKLYNPLDTNQFKGLDTLNVVTGPVLVRQVEGRPVLFVHGLYAERHAKRMLVRVDLDSERVTVLRRGTPDTLGWVVNPDGQVLAEHEYDERNQRWAIKLNRGDQGYVEVASGQAAIDPTRPTGLGPSADTVLVHTQASGDSQWQLLSVKDGRLGAPLADYRRFARTVQDPRNGLVIGGVERLNGGVRHRFFDAGLQQRWDTLLEDYADANVHLVSATPGLSQVLVLVDGPAAGHKYLWHDLVAGEAQAIGDSHTGVKQTAPVRPLVYNAADGLAIPAFLTLPVGKVAKGLPLVVLPHGGPQVADTGDFDWWSQALADQGYAVLRPNFRGSALGGDFVARGHGEWGRKMQTDLSDGVKHLVQQGVVDPARVCIVGASYGGYAAMQGGVRQGEVYRCAVAVAGV
ncbi:MAG: peptidase S9, partial [Alphaproteobacteria bacterium PA3]